MIRYLLVQNRQGKTRLAKWWATYDDHEKQNIMRDVWRSVMGRDKNHANFIELRNHKIVYRRYASLYFCMSIDLNDNELAALEAVHLLVEVMDQFFGSVCELDLVFNFYKVYAILDEVILAGEVLETSKSALLQRLMTLDHKE